MIMLAGSEQASLERRNLSLHFHVIRTQFLQLINGSRAKLNVAQPNYPYPNF